MKAEIEGGIKTTDECILGLRAKFDRDLIRESGESVRYLVVSVTAPRAKQETARPPLNLSLVLDASSSMEGRPLESVKRAAAGVIESLSERDIVSVISFAGDIRTHVDGSRLNGSATARALASINTITSRHMTNLSAGWLRGAECAARVMEEFPECHNRVVLLSDGYANLGITGSMDLALHADEWCDRRIFTSTVGIGDDYSAAQLQVIAAFGGGRMHDAERPEEIIKVLLGELAELADTMVESVLVSLSVPPGVEVENLSGFPMELTQTRAVTHVGSLRTEASSAVVFKITTPAGAVGDSLTFEVAATWTWPAKRTPVTGNSITTSLTFTCSNENSKQPRDREGSLLVAHIWQATIVRQTADLYRSRQILVAERYLDGQLRFFGRYCRDLPGIDHLIEELEGMRRVVGLDETDQRHTTRLGWCMYLPEL